MKYNAAKHQIENKIIENNNTNKRKQTNIIIETTPNQIKQNKKTNKRMQIQTNTNKPKLTNKTKNKLSKTHSNNNFQKHTNETNHMKNRKSN